MDQKKFSLEEAHQEFAKKANGDVWTQLQNPKRTGEEEAEMLRAAHASYYHWLAVGTGAHFQRAEWLLSRVYCELKDPRGALRHAQNCLHLTEKHASLLDDFDTAYAYECLARAQALSGNLDEARKNIDRAREAGHAISNEENRKLFEEDLKGGPWPGLKE